MLRGGLQVRAPFGHLPLADASARASLGGVNYQVFARKYRPQTFDDVLGQDHVVRTLRNAITQNRLAHAYLFVGPRGTGKTSTARIFAKALNCPGGPTADFDPNESICVEIAEGRSLDVTEIDGASNNSVDDIRALRETVNYAPAVGNYRIYYIDEVHMLSTSAFNALLKTLEEPPPHVKFIFATTEAHKILPTILSRCQRFDLRRIPTPVIGQHLLHIADLENITLDPLAAHAIATGADGGMRDAQSMLDQLVAFCGNHVKEQDVLDIFGFTSHRTVSDLGGAILRGETASALSQLYQHAESGKDLSRLLADLIFHFRNLLVHRVDPEIAARDLPPEMAARLADQAELQSTDKLMLLIDQFADAEASMKWAPNKRLYFEIGLIKAAQTLGEVSLSDVVNALRRSLGGESVPLPAAGPGPKPPAPKPAAAAPSYEAAPRLGSMKDQIKASLAPQEPSPGKTGVAPVVAIIPPTPEPPQRPAALSQQSGSKEDQNDTMDPGLALAAPAAAPTPAAASTPAAAPAPAAASTPALQGEPLWQATQAEFSKKYALQSSYAAEMHFLSVDDRHLILGAPADQRMAVMSLERPATRAALENILTKFAGRRLLIKIEVREDLLSHAIIAEPDASESSPLVAAAPPVAAPAPPPAIDEAEFQNDPLIKEALRLFEARITKKG